MKQLYYKIIYLCLFIFSVGNITAQDCDLNFTVSTQSTASTCQANGTITVTMGGDLSNISHAQYGLTSASGFTINPQESNVLRNIPAGTYSVTVRAFCLKNTEYSVVKTAANITVGGTYKVPVASFIASSSRKSYPGCKTGIIALEVLNGSGNYTFNVVEAPEGVTKGTVVPNRSTNLYTLPDQNYPAGKYVVTVYDGCYTAACNFTLEDVIGFPTFANTSYTGFTPVTTDASCHSVNWYASSVSSTANPDYYRYYQDGMYEVGAAPTGGGMPTAWKTWNAANLISGNLLLNISPYTYSDFFSPKGISIYTRIKGCETNYTKLDTYMYQPLLTSSVTRTCENISYTVQPQGANYYGLLCYPLSVSVNKGSAVGEVVTTGSNLAYPASVKFAADYNSGYYYITFTDKNGVKASTNVSSTRSTFSLSYTEDYCSTQYRLTYSTTSNPCYPANVTIKDEGGAIVHTYTLTSSNTSGSFYLDYGKKYFFEGVYPNSTTSPTYTYAIPARTTTLPSAYNLTLYYTSSNYCTEDQGQLVVSPTSGVFPIGTTFTITGPAGYTTQTVKTTSASTSYYMPVTKLPAGTYILNAVNGCGNTDPKTTTVTLNGVYSGKKLDYKYENTCDGMKVSPFGNITLRGVDQPSTTFYRLVSGPTSGYDKTVIKPGESVTLGTDGTYELGIMVGSTADACVINKVTIIYTKPRITLDVTGTGGYECVDNPTSIILLKATNGVTPYYFELWNEDNTVKINLPEAKSVNGEQVSFKYGKGNETYTIRFRDNCSGGFPQKVTISDLRTPRIVYATSKEVCAGATIELKCITLGTTEYKWTGPNNWSSDKQNPIITNAQANMSGVYKVSVKPEFCGDPVLDQVEIKVYEPLTAGVITANQKICVRTTPKALSCAVTGGSGIYTYQWQSSPDGISGWSNIPGAPNTVLYTPASQVTAKTYYYRVIVTDACGSITSNTMTVDFTSCFIPVNPHINVRTSKK
ncbi:hypothetical protein CLV62_101208 [Dysgonomonas alginatilytica]|uniref:SprB-like repeat protein n=1 Tax=Dysgonomonas alginatilytica TaxID=1605892 RepID=A0A2V3PV06_9BACT|nr:hypothetical protein [Dysgonomonas alginatilytica]PXV68942.1 hypothetical protein CLV62_101208 [Dysgonomonas alginatilytica]